MSEPLFKDKPDKIIKAYDLLGNVHERNLKDFKYRVGIYGILMQNEKLLMQRHPKLKSYGLPGGGMDIDETMDIALKREFKEETGLEIKINKLFSVTDDFFTFNGEDAHGIFITYLVSKCGGKLLPEGNQEDTAEVKYIKLRDLTDKSTQRVFWPIVMEYKEQILSK